MYYITDFTQNGAIKNCIKLRFNEQYTYGTWSKGKCALEDWITIALNRNTVFDWLPELECIHIIIDSIINYIRKTSNTSIWLYKSNKNSIINLQKYQYGFKNQTRIESLTLQNVKLALQI